MADIPSKSTPLEVLIELVKLRDFRDNIKFDGYTAEDLFWDQKRLAEHDRRAGIAWANARELYAASLAVGGPKT